MKRLPGLVGGQKIRMKLVAIYLLVGILPFTFFSFYSYQNTKRLIVQGEASMLQNTLDQAVQSIDSKLELYNTISDYIFNDPGLLAPLNGTYGTNYFKMYDVIHNVISPAFQTYYSLYPQLKRITIYTGSDLHQYSTYVHKLSALPEEEPWTAGQKITYTPEWIPPDESNSGQLVLVRKIGMPGVYHDDNVLYMEINYKSVFSPLYSISENPYALLITDENGRQFFRYDTLTGDAFDTSALTGEKNNGNVIQTRIMATGWLVYCVNDTGASFLPVYNATLRSYLIAWLVIVALVLIGYLSIASTVRPIEELTGKMRAFGQGDMEITASSRRKDEIGQMVQSFNEMASHIRRLIRVTYNDEIEKKELSLRVLYAQINPHFLYNILSIINSKAIIADQPDISQIALQLSRFYRSSLNHGRDDTTVSNEMDNIRSYIALQQMLSDESFSVEYDIDEALLTIRMPNFVLQPIVENAIDHGLRNSASETRCLCIRVLREGDSIVFTVRDNGVGMDDKTLESLYRQKTEGYGIRNVNDRLLLIYGNAYQLQVESEKDEFTSVRLTLPVEFPG